MTNYQITMIKRALDEYSNVEGYVCDLEFGDC